jgi:hypothetical protein
MSTFLFILISFCISIATMGQDFRSIREKAENTVKAKHPAWKLFHKNEYKKQVVYSWGSVRRGIGISIFYGDSEREAAEVMDFENQIISVGPGKKRTEFGDEAYSSTSHRGDFAQIRFRKANVYVKVTAPKMAMAEELARELAQSVGKK